MKNPAILAAFCLFFVVSCGKNDEPEPVAAFQFEKPDGWPEPVYNFATNEITQAKFELGRKIFYDPILSRDGTISCGNCHQQFVAFAHAGHEVSHGVDDQNGTRNSPTLFNLAWQPDFFWDGGVHDLNLFAVSPITNPIEMDETMANVFEKLRKSPVYPPLFEKAWGDTAVTTDRFLKSLSQFMVMLVSADSKYDQFIKGKTDALNAEEQAGLAVFRQKCASCHTEPLFTDHSFRNNGMHQSILDEGRFRVTQQPGDEFKFKVPSLRNVGKSAPFMHNGTKKTLDLVIEHYRTGVNDSPTLDPLLKNGATLGIQISDIEKTQLIAFLNALTDEDFLRDKRFSEQ